MLVGVLVLSLACGLSAGAAASAAGAPLLVALLATLVAGNLAVVAISLLRLAVGAGPQDSWDAPGEAFEAALTGPRRSVG